MSICETRTLGIGKIQNSDLQQDDENVRLVVLKQSQISMFAVTLLSLLGVVLSADQVYKAGSIPTRPVHLTKDNFRTAIEDPATPIWLLKFYAPR